MHLVGFIIKKFVTMDGHMNVELKNLSLFWVSAFSCVKYADFLSLKW